MNFIVRILFSGLMALVPNEDGTELTVLLLNVDHAYHTSDEAAESIVHVAVSNMYAEFTKILSRAAVDARYFALVAFGGAGPVVGALVAREVGISTVFVPRSPGTLCALGALSADVVSDAVRTVHAKAEAASPATLREVYAALCAELGDWLARHGADAASSSFGLAADMRYIGQSYEIAVPLEPAWLASDGLPRILAAFHRAHERAFGHADPEAPAEIVNLRVQLRPARPRVPLAEAPATTALSRRSLALALRRLTPERTIQPGMLPSLDDRKTSRISAEPSATSSYSGLSMPLRAASTSSMAW